MEFDLDKYSKCKDNKERDALIDKCLTQSKEYPHLTTTQLEYRHKKECAEYCDDMHTINKIIK